jgi:hypothetical protein
LPKAVIVAVDNGLSGELVVRVRAMENAKMYQPQSAPIADGQSQGPWQDADVSSNSRAICVRGLTPGILYAVRVRALGGSTGTSDWSDPVTHRCM